MKKLSAVLSLILIVGLFHQGVVLAEATKQKKIANVNFVPRNRHTPATPVIVSKKAVSAPVVVAAPKV